MFLYMIIVFLFDHDTRSIETYKSICINVQCIMISIKYNDNLPQNNVNYGRHKKMKNIRIRTNVLTSIQFDALLSF